MTETIEGVRIGHAGDPVGLTGCTVVLLPPGSKGGVEVRGGAPGTRETDLLRPANLVEEVHAFLITGGSAFGLDSAGGALRWLEERGRGVALGTMRVPAVPTVTVFDLTFGIPGVRPDASTGYAACEAAVAHPVAEGRVGAGAGTAVGKVLGPGRAMWGGVGAATVEFQSGLKVAALAVVNAFGNIHDPETGQCVAGARDMSGGFVDAEHLVLLGILGQRLRGDATTVGVVVTNGDLSPTECRRAAVIASQAFPACIRPCWTAVDGDSVLLASVGEEEAEAHQVGVAGRSALVRAILRAVAIANQCEPPRLGEAR